jgi:hypothetical protein
MQIYTYGPLECFREDIGPPGRPIVFFDLDGTLIDLVRATLVAACGRYVPPRTYEVWDWDITEEEKQRVIQLFNDENFTRSLPVMQDAQELVQRISQLGVCVLGLTVRPFPEATREYCRHHVPEMEGVVFVDRTKESKADVVNQYGDVRMVLDDCPKYIDDIWRDTNVPVVVMVTHPDHPYARLERPVDAGDRVLIQASISELLEDARKFQSGRSFS